MLNRGPLVSFTFDDFPRSALWKGGEILGQHGVFGTFYVSFGLLDQDTPTGRIASASDLPELLTVGHELGSHTYAHCHAWETKPQVFEDSILANERALERILPGKKFETLSYPVSSPRPQTKRRAEKHFTCCRGGGQRFNEGVIDLNQLAAFFIEKSRSDFDAVARVIENNARRKGWLIFVTHDISEIPTPFGCTPALFEKVVRYSIASGATVLPVSQALEIVMGGKKDGLGALPAEAITAETKF
jgi:peptidoglycan/xylan/chitin deacetylase (PgdA/CDA1 family)